MKKQPNDRRGQVIMRIASEPDAAWHWRYQPAQGAAQEGSLSPDAPTHNLPITDGNLILLLPAGRILLRQVSFDGKLRRNAPQPLLWQLEDFALGEIEQLHVTVLQQQDNRYWLAAVDKSHLKRWLSQLTAWGLQPRRALPDVLALPCSSATLLGNEWLVRSGDYQGFNAAESALPLLRLFPDILCHHRPVPSGVAWQPAAVEPPLALLAQGVVNSRCNMLHGEFAVRRPAAVASKRHRLPLALACCCLLSFIVEPLWSGLQARQQTERLQQQAAALYQRYFPTALPATQPRRQVAQRIADAQAALPQPGLLALLAHSSALLNALPPGELQTLDWDGKRLTLTLSTPEQRLQPLLARFAAESFSILTEPAPGQTTRLTLTRPES
ncbi:TPA: type II secretion system protein GspL [Serratia odorifera]|nr:type II secretion system protein GspL [Serratia odorifera]